MVDDMAKFQSIRVSSRSFFFYYRLRNLFAVLFSVSCHVLAFSGSSPHSYMRRRGFYAFRERERERESRRKERRVFICGDLLWISISVEAVN